MPLYVYRHRPGSSVGVARNQNRNPRRVRIAGSVAPAFSKPERVE